MIERKKKKKIQRNATKIEIKYWILGESAQSESKNNPHGQTAVYQFKEWGNNVISDEIESLRKFIIRTLKNGVRIVKNIKKESVLF